MTTAEIAALAAEFAQKLDALTADDAAKVLAAVAVLSKHPPKRSTADRLLGPATTYKPHFAQPTQAPPVPDPYLPLNITASMPRGTAAK